jgi:hypothetical protein
VTYDFAESDRAEARRLRERCDHADPITTWDECAVCSEAMRRALNKMADLDLGPRDAEVLLQTIRDMAAS